MWHERRSRELRLGERSEPARDLSLLTMWRARSFVACVAGVQRGRRGEVECEREARREREAQSLGARRLVPYERPTISLRALVALRARIQLPPPSPFCTPATQARSFGKIDPYIIRTYLDNNNSCTVKRDRN